MECPRCRQGILGKVKATRFALIMVKCAECDAIWPVGGSIGPDNFVQFQLFLDLMGESEMDTPYEELGQFTGP